MSVPLLQTKLYAPPVCVQQIRRPALTARFSAEGSRPLTLVAVPAGFGKTTLRSNYVGWQRENGKWIESSLMAKVAPSIGGTLIMSGLKVRQFPIDS